MKRAIASIATILLLACTVSAQKKVLAATEPKTTPSGIERVQSDPASGITEYRLRPNGLQVLLAERHHTPIVTVMVVYHVGSRNEAVGYTGATHFLEHMMFKGTAKHDPSKGTGIDDVLKPIGGLDNATTYYDRTYYYDVAPAQYLSTLLELEADRMRGALLRRADQKSEMTVVRNELERNEDDPSRLLDWNEFAHAFVAHPYHHPVIGWRSDVENVPIARLRKFYDEFYYPNNASLIVIGDFQTPGALQAIQKYFAQVPASTKPFPTVYTTEPAQQGQRRFNITRGEDLPKVVVGFHTPKAVDKDDYALEVAEALLGDDKKQSSRLYKALIDTGLASDVYAYNYGLRDPSMFTMLATATPNTPSEKLETVLFEQAQKLATGQITDEELDKAKKSVWKRSKLDAADPIGMSSQLAEAIAVADWKWWVNYKKNIQSVTSADVQRVAGKYFTTTNSTVGYYYPTKKPSTTSPAPSQSGPGPQGMLDVPAEVVAPTAVAGADTARTTAPASAKAGAGATIEAPTGSAIGVATHTAAIAPQVKKKVLPNGMTVMVMPVPGSGVVSIAGKMRAGDYFHPGEMYNIPDFVSDMLSKGSAHYSKEELGSQLELMGTSLDFTAGNFWMEFQSDVVNEDFPQYVQLLADTLKNPLFSQEEMEKQRKQTDADIHASMSDTDQVATNVFYNTEYKMPCVYYQPKFEQQLVNNQKVTTEMLRAYHQAHITPANTVLAIVGDINPDKAFELVTKEFGSWSGAPAEKIDVSECQAQLSAARTITTPLADKTNAEVVIGSPAVVSIKSPDFCAATVANAALGHDTISSRLAEVREKYGYTYGISSYFAENAFGNGPWVIDFTVNPENLNKALPVVKRIVENYVKTGITKEEVANESNRLAGEYVIERMRTPRHLADAISKYEILGLGPQFMDTYPKKLRAVTLSEANAAINKYFVLDKALTSIAGTVSGAAPATQAPSP